VVLQREPHLLLVGNTLMDLFALRAASAQSVALVARDIVDSPSAAPVKVPRTHAEQNLYTLVDTLLGDEITIGSATDPTIEQWQREYLFSRAMSIYGGTEQIQYETINRFFLGAGHVVARTESVAEHDELVAAAESVLAMHDGGAEALALLEWAPHAATHPYAEQMQRESNEFDVMAMVARQGMRAAVEERNRRFGGSWWGW
jgi:hypothetical protein